MLDGDRLDRRSPALIARLLPVVERFAKHYCRLRSDGLENIPRAPALFVANHNGGITGPDTACTLATLWRALGPDAPLYALAHDFAMRHVAPLGSALARFGAIRASRDNAHRVLSTGGSVLVYPGGDLDAYRHSSRRNEIVILPRSGFIDVARRADVPIIPIVARGAHRSAYIFSEGQRIATLFGLAKRGRVERFPLALALPWGLAVGPWIPYLPLPFAIRLRVLPAMTFSRDRSALACAADVQAAMQRAMDALA